MTTESPENRKAEGIAERSLSEWMRLAEAPRRNGLPASANQNAADRIHRLEQERNCR